MSLLLIIFLVMMLLIVLSFVVALKIKFTFNSDSEKINLTILWLYPFLKAVITNEDTGLVLTVLLFNKSVFRKPLRPGKHKVNNVNLIKQAKPTDIHVNASYGFRDPFITGIACGAINIASEFINVDSIYQNPDFVTDSDYVHLDATAKVNIGSALVNLYKSNTGSES